MVLWRNNSLKRSQSVNYIFGGKIGVQNFYLWNFAVHAWTPLLQLRHEGWPARVEQGSTGCPAGLHSGTLVAAVQPVKPNIHSYDCRPKKLDYFHKKKNTIVQLQFFSIYHAANNQLTILQCCYFVTFFDDCWANT